MIKKLVPLVGVIFLLASCSNDLEFDNPEEFVPVQDETLVDNADSFSIQSRTAGSNARLNNEEFVEDELVVAYGSDKIESKIKGKISLNRDAAAKFGLTPGIYVIEYLLCYKNINKPGYDFWNEVSNNCGYIPTSDFNLNNENIILTKKRGYTLPSKDEYIRTFVLHVISDMSGRRLNRYDPCAPKDIEWVYYLSPKI